MKLLCLGLLLSAFLIGHVRSGLGHIGAAVDDACSWISQINCTPTWTLFCNSAGAQHWRLLSDDTLLSEVVIDETGYVSHVAYEDRDYFMVYKQYSPHDQLDAKSKQLFHQVQLEAKRQHVQLPSYESPPTSLRLADAPTVASHSPFAD